MKISAILVGFVLATIMVAGTASATSGTPEETMANMMYIGLSFLSEHVSMNVIDGVYFVNATNYKVPMPDETKAVFPKWNMRIEAGKPIQTSGSLYIESPANNESIGGPKSFIMGNPFGGPELQMSGHVMISNSKEIFYGEFNTANQTNVQEVEESAKVNSIPSA